MVIYLHIISLLWILKFSLASEKKKKKHAVIIYGLFPVCFQKQKY